MATGGGNYDQETKELKAELDANGVVLVVLGGAARWSPPTERLRPSGFRETD